MIQKKLRSHTIIPDDLYVLRQADRQLKLILEDMGRPGYVLVARQMGKTNLLLNAKRSFANSTDVFAYLDVSNNFPDLQSFFRNIVDVILESAETSLHEASQTILKQRSERSQLPHKEHESELRIILRAISGKLVICIDEIDALTKTEYSDQVFSLIRSIYFSGRSNFKEFSRLTYVLSGVAEPSEIIKNKAISPFNIGEKIYLEDFSNQEFDEFLKKAGLHFEQQVQLAIYKWTNGNPRITWDLCSAIEDQLLVSGSISESDVDDIVQRLYLTSFDLPPIDHIRNLAEDDAEVRAALIAIHYGKSESISDVIRNRLYLRGICRFDNQTRTVYIKNKIIEEALSESWLRQVDKQKLSIGDIAKQYFDDGNHPEAVRSYLELIAQTTDALDHELPYYYIGLSCYYMGQHRAAISYLTKQPLKKNYLMPYLTGKRVLAICHYHFNELDAAIENYREVLASANETDHPYQFLDANTSLAGVLLKADKSNYDEAVRLLKRAISGLSHQLEIADPGDKIGLENLLTISKTNYFTALIDANEIEQANAVLADALKICSPSIKPHLLMLAAQGTEDPLQVEGFYNQAVDVIVDNNLAIQSAIKDVYLFSPKTCVDLLVRLHKIDSEQQLFRLIDHIISNIDNHELRAYELSEFLVSRLLEVNAEKPATYLIKELSKLPIEQISRRTKKLTLALMVVINQSELAFHHYAYINFLQEGGNEKTEVDFAAAYILVFNALESGDVKQAELIISLTGDLASGELPENVKINGAIVIAYLQTIVRMRTLTGIELYQCATEFLDLIENASPISLAFFPPDMLSHFQSSVRSLLSRSHRKAVPQVIRNEKKYGRNELVTVRFQNGTVEKGKYKNFTVALLAKKCEIISLES